MGEEEGIGSYTKDRAVRNDRISRLPEHTSHFWRRGGDEGIQYVASHEETK